MDWYFLQGNGGSDWLVYVIAGLSAALFVFRKIRGEDGYLEDEQYIANWVVFYKNVAPVAGWRNANLCFFVYALGTLSTVLILAYFLALKG